MDLFKAIFAESSSESETETELNNEESTSSPREDTAGGRIDTSVDVAIPRKSRWQDLSAVANKPLSVTNLNSDNTARNAAGTESGIAAANVKEVAGDETEAAEIPATQEEEQEVFGPALPPGQLVTRSNHPPL